MNRYTKKYKKELKLTHKRKEALLKWIKMLENGELKVERANYGNFSRKILEDILGYDYDTNIEEDAKTEYGIGFSEFVLKKDEKKLMVIEIKGSDTNLDKPQSSRKDRKTPVKQAFDYAQDTGDVDWIMVTNYDEFRLYNYHEKPHKYISFKIGDLKDPENFKQFMLAFSKFSVIDANLIGKLLDKTISVERDLEDGFYNLYNETRLMLIAELEQLHPDFSRDESIHYAQLILNRYIFICFAEDLGLLPEQISYKTLMNPVEIGRFGRAELWHQLNELFKDVNLGNEFNKVYGYNGGLFSEDLEFLGIRDIVEDKSIFKDFYKKWSFEEYLRSVEDKLGSYKNKINPIYKNLMIISSFNFSSEVDVNILGHIFENSIGEIEELKEDLKGRRKKEGIYYTPEYITDYICRNTIIPYLSKSRKVDNVNDLLNEYSDDKIDLLDEKVKHIKIVDPACGSGAFLNKAADVLLEIHEAIYHRKYEDEKTLKKYFDSVEERRKILLDNIYGVDINEESVEITKLSLFLKVCRKGLKLPNLDNNIKCGNSLIDNPKYTDKPFNWEEQFKTIFDTGGFDVVIGNPPYVRQEKIKEIKPYLKENYEVYTGVADLYVYFFEKGLKILKNKGQLGYISSNKFIKANYGKKLRKFILENTIFERYVDHTWDKIFEGATTYPSVFILKNEKSSKRDLISVDNNFEIKQSNLNLDGWSFHSPEISNLKNKIENSGIRIKDFDGIDIYYGVKTGFNKAFIIDEKTKNQLINEDTKNKDIIKPLIRGRDIKKWQINFNDTYLLFINWGFNIDNYLSIKKYLLEFKDKLGNRSVVKNGRIKWFVLSSYGATYYTKFESPKLIYPVIAPRLLAVYDDENFYINDKCFMISTENVDLKYLGALLSSSTLHFVFKLLSSSLQGDYYELRKIYIEQLPIYSATVEQQKPFIEKADQMLQLNKELMDEINGFKEWLKTTFGVEKFSKKLDKYYELDFIDFLEELKKKKVDTTPRKNQERLRKEFEDSLKVIKPLQVEIYETDEKIDKMVYELYGLSSEEIKIIEVFNDS
jgi:hypothetical protein